VAGAEPGHGSDEKHKPTHHHYQRHRPNVGLDEERCRRDGADEPSAPPQQYPGGEEKEQQRR